MKYNCGKRGFYGILWRSSLSDKEVEIERVICSDRALFVRTFPSMYVYG